VQRSLVFFLIICYLLGKSSIPGVILNRTDKKGIVAAKALERKAIKKTLKACNLIFENPF